jgi:hypothetical protein
MTFKNQHIRKDCEEREFWGSWHSSATGGIKCVFCWHTSVTDGTISVFFWQIQLQMAFIVCSVSVPQLDGINNVLCWHT